MCRAWCGQGMAWISLNVPCVEKVVSFSNLASRGMQGSENNYSQPVVDPEWHDSVVVILGWTLIVFCLYVSESVSAYSPQ